MSAQASRAARNDAAHDVVFNGRGTTLEELELRVRALHECWCMQAQKRATTRFAQQDLL